MGINVKSLLFTISLSVIFVLLILMNLFVFVSGPMEKIRRHEAKIVSRLEEDFRLNDASILRESNMGTPVWVGRATLNSEKIYFACDTYGNLLKWIQEDQIDLPKAVEYVSETFDFEANVTIGYYDAQMVIAVIGSKQELLLSPEDYAVLFKMEIEQ